MDLKRPPTIPNRTALNVQVLISCSSDAPKVHVKGTDLDCGLPNPSTLFSLKTLNALTTGLIERADSDANMYPTNPDLSLNMAPNPNVSVTTNSNASAIANSNSDANTGVSTRTKVIIAVTIVVGIALAVAVALCRFTVNRKLQKSGPKKKMRKSLSRRRSTLWQKMDPS